MVTRRRFLVLLGAAGAAAGGVALGVTTLPDDSSDDASGPPRIRYGEDNCALCNMVIADPRHAAAWRDGSGNVARFDDIGCMVNKLRRQDPGDGTTFYVHDYNDESWIEAPAATYVIAPAIKGPMAYGLAALSSPAAATALAEQHDGAVHDWAGVLDNLEQRG